MTNETGKKSPEMVEFLNAFTEKAFGTKFSPTDVCPTCGRESFRDKLSLKEFKISHMCQKCQDEVFGI